MMDPVQDMNGMKLAILLLSVDLYLPPHDALAKFARIRGSKLEYLELPPEHVRLITRAHPCRLIP